jgi:hypothetical protein
MRTLAKLAGLSCFNRPMALSDTAADPDRNEALVLHALDALEAKVDGLGGFKGKNSSRLAMTQSASWGLRTAPRLGALADTTAS